MTIAVERPFLPGTTGWSADDLDDPEIERQWCQGRYEIVEGVLTIMPPAMFDGGLALQRLVRLCSDHTIANGLGDGFAIEVDVILGHRRVPVVDAIFLTPQEKERQKAAHRARG